MATQNVTLFQYLTAFITIVLAIALSDMLMSAHRLIIARKRVKWSVVPLIAAAFVFLNVLSEFFSVWYAADVKAVTFQYLVLLVLVSGAAAMAAFAALPDEVPADGLDLWASYLDRRVYLYIVLILDMVGDMGRYTLFYFGAHGAMPPSLRVFLGDAVAIALFAILAWSKDRRVHAAVLLLVFGYVYYAFVGGTIK